MTLQNHLVIHWMMLKALSIAQVQTQFWKKGERFDSGYYAHERLSIEFNNKKEKIAEFINAFSKNDFNTEITFTFKLSDEIKRALREQVILNDIKDASSKAEIFAKSKELKLGSIIKIKQGTYQANLHPL